MFVPLLLIAFAALFLIIYAQGVVIASLRRRIETLRRYNHRLVAELLAVTEEDPT
jgi:hypothetical protein